MNASTTTKGTKNVPWSGASSFLHTQITNKNAEQQPICISSFFLFQGLTCLDGTTSSTSISVFSSVAWATLMRFFWETEKTFVDVWTACFLMVEMSYHRPRYIR